MEVEERTFSTSYLPPLQQPIHSTTSFGRSRFSFDAPSPLPLFRFNDSRGGGG